MAVSPPFRLFELADLNCWSLLLSAADIDRAVVRIFERLKRQPYGYGWEGLATHLLENDLEEIADHISLDCESDTFCAYAPTSAPLVRLAERLLELYASPARLEEALRSAPRDLWSEMYLPDD